MQSPDSHLITCSGVLWLGGESQVEFWTGVLQHCVELSDVRQWFRIGKTDIHFHYGYSMEGVIEVGMHKGEK